MKNDIKTRAAEIAADPRIAEKGGIDFLRGLVREVVNCVKNHGYTVQDATYEVLCARGFEDRDPPAGTRDLIADSVRHMMGR